MLATDRRYQLSRETLAPAGHHSQYAKSHPPLAFDDRSTSRPGPHRRASSVIALVENAGQTGYLAISAQTLAEP
jgi:hypothetical protein